jgi:hypothetical protein
LSNLVFVLFVLGAFAAVLAGAAFLLEKRAKARRPAGAPLPEPGPLGRTLQGVIRALVVVMAISALGMLLLGLFKLVWFVGGCLVAYVVVSQIYRAVRLTGK